MYTLTGHALMRIAERNISTEDLAAALEGRVFPHCYGTHMLFDSRTRVGVIFDPDNLHIITVFRLKRKQVKKWCSR